MLKILLNINLIFISLLIIGCYSFTGGSVPTHLKTINIQNVNDVSGFGNPEYKDLLFHNLLNNFQRDNSLKLVEFGGDCKLIVIISSINEAAISINPGELETERKITVVCDVEFFDAINQKQIFKRNFNNYDVYAVRDGQQGRDLAIKKIITRLGEDILLAVVSGW